MEIRPYVSSDWKDVCEIYDLSKPDEMRGSVTVEAVLPLEHDPSMLVLFRDSLIVVAEEADQIIGFGGLKGNYISWLFVHPSHRRQGVARSLLREIMGRIEGTITLNVAAENHPARNLYGGLGFTIARKFIGQYEGHDLAVLTLTYEHAGST
jgi:ribosomal protein S18 acetylase RimI-like enzyme